MADKQPAIMFYTGDWLKDPAVSLCTPATRGIWMDLLCCMHELDRCGRLSGTAEQLARLCRATAVELTHAVAELSTTEACDVTERHGVVTLTNRRMRRAWEARKSAAERKKRQRDRESLDCPADVPKKSRAPSSSSSSISSSEKSPPAPPKRRASRLAETAAAVTGLPDGNGKGQPTTAAPTVRVPGNDRGIPKPVITAAVEFCEHERAAEGTTPGLTELRMSDLSRLVADWKAGPVIDALQDAVRNGISWGAMKTGVPASLGARARNQKWAEEDARRKKAPRKTITDEMQKAIDEVFDE